MANVSYRKTLNIEAIRGDEFVVYFEFLEDCDGTEVALEDIGAQFTAQVRDGEDSSAPLILDFTTSDFAIVNNVGPIARMHKAAVLMVVPSGNYFWEMRMVNTVHSREATIFAGEFNILENLIP